LFPKDDPERADLKVKRFISANDDNKGITHNAEDNPYLECMFRNILRGRRNPSFSLFTKSSFRSDDNTIKLFASTSEKDRQTHARNHCNVEGCMPVDGIFLKKGEEILDPLQLNDKQPDYFTLYMIEFLKGIGTNMSYDAFILYFTGRQYYGKYT
jgi:hypothetical protein